MNFHPLEKTSFDIVSDNIETLKSLFPEAFTEGKIDFEVLKQLLGGTVDEREEKYGLNWHGKRRARQLALTPSTGTLLPCPEDSVDWDTTQNLMIEGDNLEVLKLLQKTYAGKVKLIYIDPPYNTGKDFVYPDDFRDNIKNYLELTEQLEGGRKITSNTETSGRFHTEWLNMIYPRLKLAKNLLRENGIIFISIDDNELENLIKIMDEVFGEENWLSTLPTIMNLKGNNDEFAFAGTHEYTVAYSKSKDNCKVNEWPVEEEELDEWEEDEIGPFKKGANLKSTGKNAPREKRPNLFFPIYVSADYLTLSLSRTSESDLEIFPITDGAEMSWRWSRNKFANQPKDIIIQPNENGEISIYKKQRPALNEFPSKKPKSIFYKPEYSSGNGTGELKDLFDKKAFDSTPKPLRLLRDLLIIGSDKDSIVVDLTAGSGTFGHAVFLQNLEDLGARKVILVQLPECLRPETPTQKEAIEFCRSINRPLVISEITKERLRRAGAKIKAENPLFQGDTGFRVFKLASSNIQAWNTDAANLESNLLTSAEHLVQGRTEQDVLYELLLKLGLDLCTPLETKTIAAKTVYSVGKGRLIACLDTKIDRNIVAPLAQGLIDWHSNLGAPKDATIIFRDSGFVDDVAKTNLAETLKQAGLTNLRSL